MITFFPIREFLDLISWLQQSSIATSELLKQKCILSILNTF